MHKNFIGNYQDNQPTRGRDSEGLFLQLPGAPKSKKERSLAQFRNPKLNRSLRKLENHWARALFFWN
jgi:hypothetical protein